jgi:hypothetical protein
VLHRFVPDSLELAYGRRGVRRNPFRLAGVAIQHGPQNHFQCVEQAPVSALNKITRQPDQSQMARRVPFGPRLGRFPLAGPNKLHKALPGRRNYALNPREVFLLILEELRQGHFQGLCDLAKGLGPRLEVTILNPRKIRPCDAAPLA